MRYLLAAAFAATLPFGAMASTLTGDDVSLTFDGNGTIASGTVGDGTDVTLGAFEFDLNGGAEENQFAWTATDSAFFGGGTTGITFSGLDFATGVLSGFTLSETALSDLDFSFTDTSISFTFSDTDLSPAGTLLAGTFLTSEQTDPGNGDGGPVPAVPLPAGLPLLALGLGTLGLTRRKS